MVTKEKYSSFQIQTLKNFAEMKDRWQPNNFIEIKFKLPELPSL